MSNFALVVQITAVILGFASTILGLYVTVRLYRFKEDLVKQINGTYVRADVFRQWRHDHEIIFERVRAKVEDE